MGKSWGAASLPSADEQRAIKRAALIAQAARAFRVRGFHATSMEDIAAALGVTKGALYRYIANKQEILFECFKASARLADAALEHAEAPKLDGLQTLQRFIVEFVTTYLQHNAAGGAMIDIDALFPEQRAEVIEERDRVDAALRRIVARGMADGSILARDPKLTVLTLMGAINWIPSWFSPAGAWQPADIAQTMADIFVRGLGAEAAATPGAPKAAKPATTAKVGKTAAGNTSRRKAAG